jgi:hypothetical protein
MRIAFLRSSACIRMTLRQRYSCSKRIKGQKKCRDRRDHFSRALSVGRRHFVNGKGSRLPCTSICFLIIASTKSRMLADVARWEENGVAVRRDKAPFFRGCNSRPATLAPASSNRSGDGGNEIAEAFDEEEMVSPHFLSPASRNNGAEMPPAEACFTPAQQLSRRQCRKLPAAPAANGAARSPRAPGPSAFS